MCSSWCVCVCPASLPSLSGISSCFVFVSAAVQFNSTVLLCLCESSFCYAVGCSTLTCVCTVLQTGRLPPWCSWWPAPWQPLWPSWWPSFPSAGGQRGTCTASWPCSSSLQVCHQLLPTLFGYLSTSPTAHHVQVHLETEKKQKVHTVYAFAATTTISI